MKHSPTPWEFDGDGYLPCDFAYGSRDGVDRKSADRAFARQAVNAHDACVSALEDARRALIIEGYGPGYKTIEIIDAALALAKGESQ